MGNKIFIYSFLGLGLLLQVITYIVTQDSFLSLTSGLCGIVSVVLCSRKKMLFYWFGFAQLFTYVALCLQQKLYGEIAENMFYLVTMLYGIYHWNKNYDNEKLEVKTRGFNLETNLDVLSFTVIGIVLLYIILSHTDDTQPFMDAITTVPAITAQILMILRYKESWFYWLIIDIGSIIMWVNANNWCMVAQFVFWSINCIYGYYKWRKNGEIQC